MVGAILSPGKRTVTVALRVMGLSQEGQFAKYHGIETQRQWSDLAIARTTPSLLGLFSWITVAAHVLRQEQPLPVRQAAWYVKDHPTFSDAIAWVRLPLWHSVMTFCMSPLRPNVAKIPAAWVNHLIETLCYAT